MWQNNQKCHKILRHQMTKTSSRWVLKGIEVHTYKQTNIALQIFTNTYMYRYKYISYNQKGSFQEMTICKRNVVKQMSLLLPHMNV